MSNYSGELRIVSEGVRIFRFFVGCYVYNLIEGRGWGVRFFGCM